MPNALRYNEALAWVERYDPPRSGVRLRFKIDEQLSLDDIEKLVIIRVLMPVIFAFDNAESNDGIIHSHKRLIVPRMTDGTDDVIEGDCLEWGTQDVEMRLVWER